MWSVSGTWHRGGAGGAGLQRVDLEAAPAEQHLVADGRGDLDQLLAQADRPAADGDVLGGEIDVLGQPVLELDVAVVRVAVDVVGGLLDGRPHAGQRAVHRLVAGELDRARHRLARRVGRADRPARGAGGRSPDQSMGRRTALCLRLLAAVYAVGSAVNVRRRARAAEWDSLLMSCRPQRRPEVQILSPPPRLTISHTMKTSARSSTDRASDYGSEGWGFESLRARSTIHRL